MILMPTQKRYLCTRQIVEELEVAPGAIISEILEGNLQVLGLEIVTKLPEKTTKQRKNAL